MKWTMQQKLRKEIAARMVSHTHLDTLSIMRFFRGQPASSHPPHLILFVDICTTHYKQKFDHVDVVVVCGPHESSHTVLIEHNMHAHMDMRTSIRQNRHVLDEIFDMLADQVVEKAIELTERDTGGVKGIKVKQWQKK